MGLGVRGEESAVLDVADCGASSESVCSDELLDGSLRYGLWFATHDDDEILASCEVVEFDGLLHRVLVAVGEDEPFDVFYEF